MTLQTKKRIPWIDIAKAITIFLVVIGHTLRGGTFQKIVYSFHVAAFFLLSGVTFKAGKLKDQIKNDFLRILVPYYCFGILSILIFAVLGKFAANQLGLSVNTSWGNNLLELLYATPQSERIKFNMPLWFLPCLFATKTLYNVLHHVFHGKQLSVMVSSLVLSTLGFVYTRLKGPDLPFDLSVSLKMLAFLSLGSAFSLWLPTVKDSYFDRRNATLTGIALLTVTVVIACVSPKVDYASDSFPCIAPFLTTAVMGSFGVCLLAMGLGNCKTLEYVGKNSLAILVMHKFPVLLFQTIGPQKTLLTQYDSPLCVIVSGVIAVVCIVLCLAANWIIRRIFPFLLGDFSVFTRKK